jgi:hypothetical protein
MLQLSSMQFLYREARIGGSPIHYTIAPFRNWVFCEEHAKPVSVPASSSV